MLIAAFQMIADISIHAPREGGDSRNSAAAQRQKGFQSTPPARGATPSSVFDNKILMISIHAPREGGDQGRNSRTRLREHFNPRPPRGGRLRRTRRYPDQSRFQSTPPARGATAAGAAGAATITVFQSTPPARGATWHFDGIGTLIGHFNPRPPRGGRPNIIAPKPIKKEISIHAPREGGDTSSTRLKWTSFLFQSTPPARGATA